MPAIAAAISTGSAIGNIVQQGNMNKAARRFAIDTYNRQRRDALSDWTMQNEYNHPSSQMARLRQAGLNPHLVYGNGAVANSQDVRSSNQPSWNPQPPQFEGNSVMSFYDVSIKEAQLDNLRAQNTVLANDALLKQAQSVATLTAADKTKVDTAIANVDLTYADILKQLQQNNSQADIWKKSTETDYIKQQTEASKQGMQLALSANERAEALKTASLQEAAARILSMRIANAKTEQERKNAEQQFQNLKGEAMLKQMDIDLRRAGINPGDPGWFKALEKILGSR